MKRLFFSLYIAITLGLLVINWTSEYLWQQLQDHKLATNNQELAQITELATLSVNALLSEPPSVSNQSVVTRQDLEKRLAKLNQQYQQQFQFSVAANDQIGFSPSQTQRLQQGKAIPLYSEHGQLILFIQHKPDVLIKIEKPLSPTLSNHGNRSELTDQANNKHDEPIARPLSDYAFYLKLLSYGLLGGLIFIWSKPLWRDISLLKKMTDTFSQQTVPLSNPLSKRSVVFELGATIGRMSHKIVQLIATQSEMTHAISHDIRTPLARLKFSLALLNHKTPEPDLIEKTILEMNADISEIEFLIEEILTFGRLDTLESPLNREPVNIHQLLCNLVEKLQRAEIKPCQLNVPDNIVFYCDGHLLERAIQNLITNAFRYADGRIKVSVKFDKTLKIAVEDDGNGIAKEHWGRVFEPFQRLEQSRGKKGGGFGLGLSIAQKIVQWHNGQITLDKSSMGGARFTIEIPQQG